MKTHRQALGAWGENQAAEYLQERSYTILERNARTPYGELDLVASQPMPRIGDQPAGQVVVFIEVKTRRSQAYGLPEEAVTERKKAHLLAAAQAYLQAHPELEGDWRVDVVAVEHTSADQEPVITHFENVIT
ncbi:MAG: YraN family protein [Anaerolineales bacterium]|nr:YraN family protein [Anaerolineales bacterium]